jgi:hypothetical protein
MLIDSIWKLDLCEKTIKESKIALFPITNSLLDEGNVEYSGVKM